MDKTDRLNKTDRLTASKPAAARLGLWTWQFFLLFQGQMVSSVGDALYYLALGFYIVNATGSSTLMGGIAGVSALAGLIASPIAGAIADRIHRKILIVGMDVVRGLTILAVALLLLTRHAPIWVLFLVGVITNTSAAFFNPAISAALPDMVPPSQLPQANSVINSGRAASSVLSTSIAGQLYALIGAPFLFLVNGIAYLFSAFTEIFLKIPRVVRPADHKPATLKQDLMEGVRFVGRLQGMRLLMLATLIVNFFANMAFVLFVPLFARMPALGEARCGFTMAALGVGQILGTGITMLIHIPHKARPALAGVTGIVGSLCFAIGPQLCLTGLLPLEAPLSAGYVLLNALVLLGSMCYAIFVMFVNVTVQQSTPTHMRGKVSGFMAMLSTSLAPAAMLVGGILGDLVSIPLIMFVCMTMVAIFVSVVIRFRSLRALFRYDPEAEKEAHVRELEGGQAE